MSTSPGTLPEEQKQADAAALLARILAAVEKDDRKRWVEIALALILSLATVGSAWCAYQSTLWGGVQTFRLAAVTRAGRAATQSTVVAMQGRALDATMLISYLEAESRDDKRMQKFLFERFRPEMKVAVEAWLKTDPFNNSKSPPSPFKMDEYKQPELTAAQRQNELVEEEYARAQHANQTSDMYVLLTVAFASVLFFAGIGGTFGSRRLRISAFVIAVALLALTLFVLGSMPICHE